MTTQSLGCSRSASVHCWGALLLSLILGVLGTALLLLLVPSVAIASSLGKSVTPPHLGDATPFTTPFGTPTWHITKTVDPTHIDTGGQISICWTLLRPGLDGVLVQDVSGSMEDPVKEGVTQTSRLTASQVVATAFVRSLQGTDRGAVVPYSSAVHLSQVQSLTNKKDRILKAIGGLTTGGWTNIGRGISAGHIELITPAHFVSDTVKAIILLSDGNANCDENGHCSEDEEVVTKAEQYAREMAERAADDNIRVHTIGFGSDANEDLLQDIAGIGGGEYFSAPNVSVLETLYLTIASEFHDLVITDIITPGIEADCSQWPDGGCVEEPGGVTTATLPINDTLLISNPLTLCFTAIVNLDPGYEGPTNLPNSNICYQDSEGHTVCREFDNPPIVVDGRKITGSVFCDFNANGLREEDEEGVPGVVVRTSTGVTTSTSLSGSYILRTSTEPAIAVTLDVPPGYFPTTPISEEIPPAAGIYTIDFGICGRMYLPVVTRYYPLPSIINGGFENGWTGWTHGGELAQSIVCTHSHSGNCSALLGDPAYKCKKGVPIGRAWIEQGIFVVPTDSPELSFRYNIFTHDKNSDLGDKYDSFDVRVNGVLIFRDMNTANPYKCDNLRNLGWKQHTIDLRPYKTEYITIRFENWNRYDHWYNTWTYVDDVRIDW